MCWRQCGSTCQICLVMREKQHIFMHIIKNNQGERYFCQVLNNCKKKVKGKGGQKIEKTIDEGIATN